LRIPRIDREYEGHDGFTVRLGPAEGDEVRSAPQAHVFTMGYLAVAEIVPDKGDTILHIADLEIRVLHPAGRIETHRHPSGNRGFHHGLNRIAPYGQGQLHAAGFGDDGGALRVQPQRGGREKYSEKNL